MPDFHSVIRALKSRSHVEKNLNAYIGIVKNNAFRFALVDLSLKSLSMAEAWRDSLLGNEDFSEAARLLSE